MLPTAAELPLRHLATKECHMADAIDPGGLSPLRLFPWLRVFRAIRIATDTKKLILSTLGLVLLDAGWSVIDRFVPDAEETTPSIRWKPLATIALRPESIGSAVSSAFALVADPPRTLAAPLVALFDPRPAPGTFWQALLGGIWAVLVWGIIGGAIARIALVKLATGERVGVWTSLCFSLKQWTGMVGAPLSPLVGAAVVAVPCAVMGALYRIPGGATATALGALAFLPLLAGLIMAIILIGLAAGWPLMPVAIAAECEDGFDAISRSYAYVYQRSGHYAAYVGLAWVLGTIGLFVVAVFTRVTLDLALWALSFGAPDDRLFALFLADPGAPTTTATRIHQFWITIVGLLAYGWVYSYFWTATAIIYVLLRHEVDGASFDDIAQVGLREDLSTPPPELALGETSATSEGPPNRQVSESG
jgi:hypothetical protein